MNQENRFNLGNPLEDRRNHLDRQTEELSASLASLANDTERPIHPGVTTNKILLGTLKVMDERLSALEVAVKKPHWSVVPSFWLLVLTAVLALVSVEPSQLKQRVHLEQLFPQKQPPIAEHPQTQPSSAARTREISVSTTKK